MLSLLRKKTDAGTGAAAFRPWHPNLRNVAKLPDTKVVRTSFFVNGAALFITVGVLLWFAFQEYKLHNLNRQIADWQSQIDRDKKDSDRFVAMYGKFKDEQGKVAEINAFVESKPPVTPVLMYLGETLPPQIAFDSYEQGEKGITLRGTVKGTPDEATGYATAYLDQLRADKKLSGLFSEIAYSGAGVARDPQTGRLSLQLFFKFAAAKGGKK
ncbi:MAG: hypothetical protein JSR48_00875 [Verrucomicrobia bacterium]|nr:hypothetical protein [Verrucomicrobiota bacterium]